MAQKKLGRPKPFKQGSVSYHQKRAIGGAAATLLAAPAPVSLPYTAYHTTRMIKADKITNTRNAKTGTRTSSPQPVRAQGRVKKRG